MWTGIMDALGTETTRGMCTTFVPLDLPARSELLYIAMVGRAVAVMGGQLELRAVFGGQEFLLFSEPGPEHINDDIVHSRFRKR